VSDTDQHIQAEPETKTAEDEQVACKHITFIHSCIYKAPLQEIYSEAPPSSAMAIQISLKQPAECTHPNTVKHLLCLLCKYLHFKS